MSMEHDPVFMRAVVAFDRLADQVQVPLYHGVFFEHDLCPRCSWGEIFDVWVQTTKRDPFASTYKDATWGEWRGGVRFLWAVGDSVWGKVQRQIQPTYQTRLRENEANEFISSMWRWKICESALWLAEEKRYGLSQHERLVPLASETDTLAAHAFEARHGIKFALPVVTDETFAEPFRHMLLYSLAELYFPKPVSYKRWPWVAPAVRKEAEERGLPVEAVFREAIIKCVLALEVPHEYPVGYLWDRG